MQTGKEICAFFRSMKLTGMAEDLEEQMGNPQYEQLPFLQRMGSLVDAEVTRRTNAKLAKLLKDARLVDPGACIEDILYLPERNLEQSRIVELGSCDWIDRSANVAFLGPSGSGKSYLACALANAAVRKLYPVLYVRLPDLIAELAAARVAGTYQKVMDRYKKPSVLVLDEWLLYKLDNTATRDVLELVAARCGKGSTIFCSQYDIPEWHSRLTDPVAADAICDRIIYWTYIFRMGGESMRKRTRVDKITDDNTAF